MHGGQTLETFSNMFKSQGKIKLVNHDLNQLLERTYTATRLPERFCHGVVDSSWEMPSLFVTVWLLLLGGYGCVMSSTKMACLKCVTQELMFDAEQSFPRVRAGRRRF